MKSHKKMMIIFVAVAVIFIIFAPQFGISRGFGLFLLICPLMMLGMMAMMGNDHKH